MSEKKFIIAGIGEILWDVLSPTDKRLGGAPANFAYYAGKFGAESYPVSSIGNDSDGNEILSVMKKNGLSTDYISRNSHPTGVVNVNLDSQGKPCYKIKEDVAWDHVEMTAKLLDLSKKLDAVCFGTLAQRSADSRKTIQKFISGTNPECIRILDINLRQNYFNLASICESLDMSDILKLNDEELPVVSKMMSLEGDEGKIIHALMEKFKLDIVILTKGAKGARIVSRTEDISEIPTKKVDIVDTVGAGDSFTAVVAVGLLQKKDLSNILSEANEVAGIVCSQSGAMVEFSSKSISS
ncbi:MAG: hypothetical protein A2X48_00640 [Lentisphaerae bacterium GWF2_49_21]|nr:MAG: hypothetical protein A2X48_00640 [Lentisphaerae bacterium GWF2_49_21]